MYILIQLLITHNKLLLYFILSNNLGSKIEES